MGKVKGMHQTSVLGEEEGERWLAKLKVADLKSILRFLDLGVGGTKPVLVSRLLEEATVSLVEVEGEEPRLCFFLEGDPDGALFDPSTGSVSIIIDERGGGKASGGKVAAKGGDGGASLLVRFPLMAALAVQYGLQTHFQKKYLSKDVNKLGLILACEVIKLIIAMAALFVESMNGKPVNLFSRETARSVVLCSAPALIYVVQNFCVQTAYVELNPITFNCLNQTKLITTATALYLIKGVRQNKKQMLALSLVSVGAMLLSVRGSENGANAENMSTTTGVAMSLTGTVLSGIAATVTQIFMQDMRLSPFLVTLAMCIVSIVTVGSSIVSQTKIMGEPLLSVFDHWTASSIVPVITQALGGLLVGLVTNYCGSIDKGISFVCGLAVSAVCQCAVTRVMLPWNALLALLFVAQGSFMHTKESMLAKVRAKTKTQ